MPHTPPPSITKANSEARIDYEKTECGIETKSTTTTHATVGDPSGTDRRRVQTALTNAEAGQ